MVQCINASKTSTRNGDGHRYRRGISMFKMAQEVQRSGLAVSIVCITITYTHHKQTDRNLERDAYLARIDSKNEIR